MNLSEKPLIPKPTKLSQILESNPDPKYRLSAKACQGILNRAKKRGKELPELLRIALEKQSGGGIKTYDVRISSEGTKNQRAHCYETDRSRALDTGGEKPDSNHGGVTIIQRRFSNVNTFDNEISPTLEAGAGEGGNNMPMVMGCDLYNQTITGNVSKTLNAIKSDSDHVPCVCFEPGSASRVGGHVYEDDVSGSLRANAGDNQQSVVCIEGNGVRESHKGDGYKESDTMYTLNTVEQHAVAYGISSYDSNGMKSPNPHSGIYEADTSRTLDLNGGSPACNQGGMAVVECGGGGQEPITSSKAGFFLNARSDGKADTLVATDFKDPQLVCYGLDRASFNQGKNAKFGFSVDEELAPSLVARGPGGY